jgi:hypothetical protein
MEQTGLSEVALSPLQREQMDGLIQQIKTTRVIAENFIGYFAKELGVNLSVYQFDSDRLVFVPVAGLSLPPASDEVRAAALQNSNGHAPVPAA